MSVLGARTHVAVSFFGKWKTTLQIIGISLMLYERPLMGLNAYRVGTYFLLVAGALTVWSMLDYLQAAWPVMSGREPVLPSPQDRSSE
jgi:CDP-diacylglycerol--glycerol-3-phosphate 3-phosphatidyltransferase